MIYLALWYDECMTRCLRKYIEKCKSIFILVDFEGGDFSGNDLGEKRGHGKMILKRNLYRMKKGTKLSP
jgi:hypothetical protein